MWEDGRRGAVRVLGAGDQLSLLSLLSLLGLLSLLFLSYSTTAGFLLLCRGFTTHGQGDAHT
jgi:hypothetical protein